MTQATQAFLVVEASLAKSFATFNGLVQVIGAGRGPRSNQLDKDQVKAAHAIAAEVARLPNTNAIPYDMLQQYLMALIAACKAIETLQAPTLQVNESVLLDTIRVELDNLRTRGIPIISFLRQTDHTFIERTQTALNTKAAEATSHLAEARAKFDQDVAGSTSHINQCTLNAEKSAVEAEQDRGKIGEVLEALQGQQRQAEKYLEDMRTAAGVAGVSRHAEAFKAAEKTHTDLGHTWAKTIAVLGVLTLAGFGLLIWLTKNLGDVDRISMRVAFLAIASYFTVWAGRNYKAHRHLAVLNAQKALALDTFKTFVAASGEPEVRKQVLLETTRSIFAAGSTGYETDPGGPADRLVEVAQTMIER